MVLIFKVYKYSSKVQKVRVEGTFMVVQWKDQLNSPGETNH